MIRSVRSMDAIRLPEDPFAAKIHSLARVYGSGAGLLDIWAQEQETGSQLALIARFSGVFTISTTVEQPSQKMLEELRTFFQIAGGTSVEGNSGLLTALAIGEPVGAGSLFQSGEVQQAPPIPSGLTLESPERLSPIYELLCASDPAFANESDYAGWLTDMSHKCRHRLGSCWQLSAAHIPVSTFSVLHLGTNFAICGALATHPSHRGKGYASILLSHIAAACHTQGFQACLFSADYRLDGFYLAHNWLCSGKWQKNKL